MIIPLLGVGSLTELVESNLSMEVPSPVGCPKCKTARKLWRHGSFERLAIEGDRTAQIKVQRFLCAACGCTVSALFAFLVPYRQFTSAAIGTASENYATTKTTYRREAEELSVLDSDKTPRPSHSQVFRWVACVAKRSGQLLLHLQKEFVMQGRDAELENATTKSFCPNAAKAHSKSKASSLNDARELLQLSGMLLPAKHSLSSLHAYFLTAVESLQAIFSGRFPQLANPQRMRHVIW